MDIILFFLGGSILIGLGDMWCYQVFDILLFPVSILLVAYLFLFEPQLLLIRATSFFLVAGILCLMQFYFLNIGFGDIKYIVVATLAMPILHLYFTVLIGFILAMLLNFPRFMHSGKKRMKVPMIPYLTIGVAAVWSFL